MTDLPRPDIEFREFLEQGRFMIQRSRSTGNHVFFPRVMDPRTGAMDLEWVEASGRGTVHASTVVRVKPPAPSYNVCLIDLAEGPRMMSRVEGIEPEQVQAGMAVVAKIIMEDDQALVVFTPE